MDNEVLSAKHGWVDKLWKFFQEECRYNISGRRNIIQAKRIHDRIRKESMEDYRKKLKKEQEQREVYMNIYW